MPGGPVATGGGLGANAPKNKFAGIMMTMFAAFGGILYGYDTGTINGLQVTKNWLQTFGHQVPVTKMAPLGLALSTGQVSVVVSILSAGTFVGALAGAPIGDFIGRRLGLILTCLIFSIGVAMQTAATQWGLFLGGRFVAGLGVGLVSTLVPMYQSECAPKWIRGAVVSCYQWAITIGLLLAAIFSQVCNGRNDHSAYRIPIGIQFIWAAILLIGMIILPESPRWLIKKGREEKAKKSLTRLTGLSIDDPVLIQELEDIKVNLMEEQKIGEAGWLDVLKSSHNKIRFRVLSGVGLQAWQQLSGINFIFYFGTSFFSNSGISKPFVTTVITNVVNVVMTIPGILAVDKVGRRTLLLIGAAGMTICEFMIAIVGVTVSTTNASGQKALIALVCFYIAFFASTWGPIAWVVCGEIYPLNFRAKGMALSAASNWLFNWALGFATPYLVNVGPGDAGLQSKVFFIWGSTCLGGFIFTYFFIAETKGLSLEQVDILYQNTTPIKSIAYRNQLIANDVHATDTEKIMKVNSRVEEGGITGGGLLGRKKQTDVEKAEDVSHEEGVAETP